MAQVGLPSASPLNPLPQARLAASAAGSAPPAVTPAAPSPGRDQLEMTSIPAAGALARVPLVEAMDLSTLRSQLGQAGPLRARCESLAAALPADQRKTFESLQGLLTQPDTLLSTLDFLNEEPNLNPALRDYLNQIVQQISSVLNTAQQGDAAAFSQALAKPLHVGSHALPPQLALQQLQQTLRFDQALQRQAGRELLIQNVNQAFGQGLALLDAGTPQDRIDSLVFAGMQKALGQQNNSLLASLARGEVQQSIASLQQRFTQNLQIPGFLAALQQAMTEAGLPPDKVAKLGNAEVLGKMPIEDLEKLQHSLSQQLNSLPRNAATAALRQALSSTLEQDLPQIVTLRADFQQFRFTMREHVTELTRDLSHFCRRSGLELPAALRTRLEENPLAANKDLSDWIQARRQDAVGDPRRIHTLDGLEQFGMQLFSGAAILAQVEGGDQIDTQLMDQYERFQTFILAKRALIQTFEQGNGKELKNAILEFGDRFADWQNLSPADMQQQLFAWLGQYLDQPAVTDLSQQIHSLRSGFVAHNQRVDDARLAGVELVKPEARPAWASVDISAQVIDQDAKLRELAQRESGFYRHVLQTLGEAGLHQQLKLDLEQILEPMARSMQSLAQANDKLAQPALEMVREGLPDVAEKPIPSFEQISDRIGAASRDHRLEKEVEVIKRDLIRTLRDTRQQTQALAAAQRLRDQIQHQIFELHNQRQLEAGRHRLESLQAIVQLLKEQLP